MALVLKDRVKETTTTTGTGTYTLAGAVAGFEAFSEIGNSNTTYYCCTDGTDFEVGIGTYTLSGTTLARTTILQSSNSDAAVNWTSGTRTIFCTQPAEKAVFLNASNNIKLGDNEEIILGASDDFKIKHTGSRSVISDVGTGGLRLSADADLEIMNAAGTEHKAKFTTDGAVELYHDNSKKLETTSAGATVTGNIAVTGTVDGRDVATDGTKLDGIESGATADQTKADIDALGINAATLDSLDSTSFLRNRGDGQLNGLTQNFQQDYTSPSYFTVGEYIEIASISPGGTSRNYSISGKIMAQASNNAQILDINVGIRFNSTGNFGYTILYNSSQMDTEWVEPVLWVNTTTDNIKLVIQAKTSSIHNLGVDLTFIQRSNYSDLTWNTTESQTNTTTVPTGYTEYIGEKAIGSILNGAVELYHNNVKKLETASGGISVTGEVAATSLDISGDVDVDGTLEADAITLNGTALASSATTDTTNASNISSGTLPNARLDQQLQDVAGLAVTNGNFIVGDGSNFVAESGATARASLGLGTAAVLDTGISNTNVPKFTSGVADNDFLRVDGTAIEGRSASEVLSDIAAMPLAGGTFSGDVQITDTDTGSGAGPLLTLRRNSSSPADNDLLGRIKFTGENDADEIFEYAAITGKLLDNTDGTEDGGLVFSVGQAGASVSNRISLQGYGDTVFSNKDVRFATGVDLKFEGATDDVHETILTVTDPTADRTITLPNATGTVQLTDGSGASLTSLNASELSSGTVPNARLDQQLQDVAGLAVTNGGFIVGDGSNFVLETGSTARTSLGLGSIATQASNNVSITGGSVSGITDLAIADGGTGASSASAARTNLGLGTAAVAATGISNGNVPVFTSGVADDDFLRVNGTSIEGRSASELASDIGAATTDDATALAIALG